MSIWKAAELGNMDAINYYINNYALYIDRTEDEDEESSHCLTDLINARDPNTECTLLYLIVSHNPNPTELLRLLLSQGADVTARNVYNVQAIHALFLRCQEPLEPLRLLLEYDADTNAQDGDGWTPIHYAARFCKNPLPVIQLLVDHGADINALDSSKKTCLFGLLANGDFGLTLDWLIHTGKANVKVQGDFLSGQTRCTKKGSLLLQAAKYGRLACLRILISSASSMENLDSILTLEELKLAIDLVRQQLVQVTEKNDTERLGLMIMIFENLIHKTTSHTTIIDNLSGGDEQGTNSLKRKPSLLKRMVSWKSK
jgi:ankyrin repeat protein